MDPNRKAHNSTLRPLSLKRQREIAAGTHKQKPRKAIRKKTYEEIKAEGRSVIQKLLGEGKIKKAIDMHAPKKRKPLKQKSDSELSSLDAQLLMWNNRLVRLKARQDDGTVRCFICHRDIPYEESVAMHFQGRIGRGTRFNHLALRAGCNSCNSKPNGDRKNFARRLEEESPGLSSQLTILSKQVMRYDRQWYRDMINVTREEVKQLERQ